MVERLSPREVRPPEEKEFEVDEVDSIYVDGRERYVVSLIVSYDDESVRSPRHALAAALELTRDPGSSGTLWFVFDRKTGQMMTMEQSDFELAEGESIDDYEADEPRTCPECGEPLTVEGSMTPEEFRTSGADPVHVFCDVCGKAEHPANLTTDWNGETGCHLSCEAEERHG